MLSTAQFFKKTVCFCSQGSGMVLPRFSSHCIAKAGLNHFMRHLAREEAHRGIRANVVAPGTILTDDMVKIAGFDPNSKGQFSNDCVFLIESLFITTLHF